MRWKRLIGFWLVLGTGFLGFLWVAAGEIASPERRELELYHREYLEKPGDRGLAIDRYDLIDGEVPTLVVRPDPESGVSKRGTILRGQLEKRGFQTRVYGEVEKLVVLLHGRNGRKEDLLPAAERFCAVGFLCVIPDLPAHGESKLSTVGYGAREFEQELAAGVADEVERVMGIEKLPRVLWGMSMGGSFAIHAAAKDSEMWERMVIVSSFDTLGGVIDDSWAGGFRGLVDWMIEMRGGLVVVEVKPVDLLKELKVPSLFVHGDADDLINLKRGEALFRASGGEKRFLTVEGGTHSNVLVTEAPVYAAMAEWLLEE